MMMSQPKTFLECSNPNLKLSLDLDTFTQELDNVYNQMQEQLNKEE
jgi:hypothetical protein